MQVERGDPYRRSKLAARHCAYSYAVLWTALREGGFRHFCFPVKDSEGQKSGAVAQGGLVWAERPGPALATSVCLSVSCWLQHALLSPLTATTMVWALTNIKGFLVTPGAMGTTIPKSRLRQAETGKLAYHLWKWVQRRKKQQQQTHAQIHCWQLRSSSKKHFWKMEVIPWHPGKGQPSGHCCRLVSCNYRQRDTALHFNKVLIKPGSKI